jgi:hypothetical protein
MAATWKKSWIVRAYPRAVVKFLKRMPEVYEDGARDAILGWSGRSFTPQRKDFLPKPPKLTLEKDNRLVFRHDLPSPITYTVEYSPEEKQETHIQVEVRVSGSGKESASAEQVVTLLFTLTKALEPPEE